MTGKGVMMVLLACALTISEQLLFGKQKDERATRHVSTCTAEFQQIAGHTMCKPDDRRVEQTGVSARDIQIILDIHNKNRSSVWPPATDLAPLVWNNKIAAVAQKYAQKCQTGHDKQRWVPSLGLSAGQNLAYGYNDWEEAVMAWSNEARLYTYGMDLSDWQVFKEVAHYTQMMQSNAFFIGCGFASCRNTRYTTYYVCNYASGQIDAERPYTRGRRCSACRSNCKKGLCDCGGKVCLNGGTLDLETCTCQCVHMYKGENCGEVDCSEFEPKWCAKQQPAVDCTKPFYYVHCPVQCGRCPPKEPFVSAFGCSYIGPRYGAEECNAFGENGHDIRSCASRGGSRGCDQCTRYSNVAKDFCPVQCGLCDPREAFVSEFGCKYRAVRPTAEQCQTYGVHGKDHSMCATKGGSWGCNDCYEYSNIPTEYCPVMCGVCD